ncbi:hypothetical protein NC652_040336 [Populus alba x Populus x berolinensis]|nr:hypothetical protein NC652_040336 [Populus alba x Populus x berolinensis]
MISKNILAKTSSPEYQCNMIGAEVKHIPLVLQEITLFKFQELEMGQALTEEDPDPTAQKWPRYKHHQHAGRTSALSSVNQASFFSRKRTDGRQPPLEHSLWIQMSGNGNIQLMKEAGPGTYYIIHTAGERNPPPPPPPPRRTGR